MILEMAKEKDFLGVLTLCNALTAGLETVKKEHFEAEKEIDVVAEIMKRESHLDVGGSMKNLEEAKKDFDSDPEAANQSREWVVYLQNDQSEYNDQAKIYWGAIHQSSLNHCQEVYEKLNVSLGSKNAELFEPVKQTKTASIPLIILFIFF